jgi:hypothetical protein
MDAKTRTFLRDFFRSVNDRSLDPAKDDEYIELYSNPEIAESDPVDLLARGIEWTSGEGVQLFSGFRGSGKSTELRRLRKRLQDSGYLVVLCDMEDYINLSTPIDISDFLMAVCGAFSEALETADLLGKNLVVESYWERFTSFLKKTRVEIEGVSVGPEGTGISGVALKVALKNDPTFKKRLQKRLSGHLGSFVEDVKAYTRQAVLHLKKRHGDGVEVVLLVDSLERLRGTSSNAEEVHRSAEMLFAGHADKLHLPSLHIVYAVPPYLKVLFPNLGALYTPGGMHLLPAVKICHEDGRRNEAGFVALVELIASRGDWTKLLGERSLMDLLIQHSGGHLRDLLRLVAEVLRRADLLPVGERIVRSAISQVQNEFLPIPDEDALWLHRVSQTHTASLKDGEHLPGLARFLETHMVLCYRNGKEWYDIHPLIADPVREQVEQLRDTDPTSVEIEESPVASKD